MKKKCMYFERVSSPRKTFGEYNGHECGVSELLSIQLYHVKFNNNRSNYSEKKVGRPNAPCLDFKLTMCLGRFTKLSFDFNSTRRD